MQLTRGSKAIQRTLAFACGLAFVALSLEFGLRFAAWTGRSEAEADLPPHDVRIHDFAYIDAQGVPRFEAYARGWHRSYGVDPENLVTLNSLGTPGPEPLSAPTLRIAFVGDSIVFNGGIPWRESFVALSAQALQDAGYAHSEVLNFGFSDGNLEHYEKKLEHEVLPLSPDLVYLGLYLNDTIGASASPVAIFTDDLPRRRALGASSSYLVQRIRRLWARAQASDNIPYPDRPARRAVQPGRFAWVERFEAGRWRTEPDELKALIADARNDWGAAWTREHWQQVDSALTRISKLVSAHESRLVVVLFPASPQVEVHYAFDGLDAPQRAAHAIAERLRVPVIDLAPALRSQASRQLYRDQCHFSPAGNRLVGELLGADMLERAAALGPGG